MWVRRAAIRPVPAYAELPLHALEAVEDKFSDESGAVSGELERAFARFEASQPALAERISNLLDRPIDDTAVALGYFLSIALWLAFDATFRDALGEVDELGLASVEESLTLDEQLRLADPAEAVNSDDVVAMEQPHALLFVNEHVEAALEAAAEDVDVEDVDLVYRLLLVEVLALSYAVRVPESRLAGCAEFQA